MLECFLTFLNDLLNLKQQDKLKKTLKTLSKNVGYLKTFIEVEDFDIFDMHNFMYLILLGETLDTLEDNNITVCDLEIADVSDFIVNIYINRYKSDPLDLDILEIVTVLITQDKDFVFELSNKVKEVKEQTLTKKERKKLCYQDKKN